MSYEKRIVLLRQIKRGFSADGGALSGAVYAERLGETLTLTPKIAGLAPMREGEFALAVWVGGQVFLAPFHLHVPLPSVPPLSEGLAVLLCYRLKEIAPVAYGYGGGAPQDYRVLLQKIDEEKGEASATAAARFRRGGTDGEGDADENPARVP